MPTGVEEMVAQKRKRVGNCSVSGRFRSQLLSFVGYEPTGIQYVTRWKRVSRQDCPPYTRNGMQSSRSYLTALTTHHFMLLSSCVQAMYATNLRVLLACFAYFEKIEVCLCDHRVVCVSVHPPY
jgi:hypothetical protein